MIDWLWKGIAGLAGIVALWFGFDAARMRHRMERKKREQDEAMQRMAEQTYRALKETRRQHAGKAPINLNKRQEIER